MNPKKLLSALLALSLLMSTGILAAFASAEEEVPTLTYWTSMSSTDASVMSSLDDNLYMQELQARTGVDLVFLHPAVGQESEQFSLMIASRELPDIIEYNWSSYAGSIQKAIDDGIILPLNDLIAEYAPNYAKVLEENPELARQMKTDNGTIPVFAAYSISEYNCMSGFMIRQDWLDELGLETPSTIAEWETTLLALVKEKDLACGLAIQTSNLAGDMLVGAWNIGSTYYMDDGVVKYGPTQEAYLDFLTTMKRWYDNGILDADVAAMDSKTMESYMINGEAAACFGFAGGNMGNIYTAVEAKGDESFRLVGLQYPVVEEDAESSFINMSWQYRGAGSGAITTRCKNPELACRVLDYIYSDEGRLLKSFGVEGVSFNYNEAGEPIYADVITKNPDGLSMAQALSKYVRANSPYIGFIETGYHEQYFARPVQKEAAKLWNTYLDNTSKTKLPMISLTTEESQELATMLTLINDYREEMLVKFIMGQEPLESYPEFVERLEELGVNRVLEIYQAACDRYAQR